MPHPLSVFIIALNEADRIGRTIEAVRAVADDVVVVDSGSTDGTQEVARALGARVVHNPWPGYGEQKRVGEDQCRHDWVLNVDADEVASPALAAEIAALLAGDPPADAYRITIAELFPGERRPHRFAHRLAPVRLYRRSRFRYSPSPVHDRVVLTRGARVGRLRGELHHYSVRSLGDEIAKLNRYSDLQVRDMEARGLAVPLARIYVEFLGAFLKAYFFRRHFLRGGYGFLIAMNYAFWRHLRMAKYYERRRTMRGERE